MVFNSFTFLLFFLCVLTLHNLPFSWPVKKLNLLLASYLFYAAWNPPFVVLLWISTIIDWYASRVIGSSQSSGVRRAAVLLSLLTNLGLLAFFKYGNFLIENFAAVMRLGGVDYQPPRLDIFLPVGISFYTFQTISYTLDVYRGRERPWNSFLDFALYVTFFPQLVAGPIVRSGDFLPQCAEPTPVSLRQFVWGLHLLLIGLFEKVVVADGLLAPVVESAYSMTLVSPLTAWMGTFAFAGQIFCDFAGYSTCAIGVALCLGFALPDNFRYPYAAVGFSDFWSRWHISLSTWLRDYLYIPLGGNRIGASRTYVNLMLTMLIGGLWHGAAWTFVIWGGLHALYLITERRLRSTELGQWCGWGTAPGRAFLGLVTFLLICITWTFFRAESIDQAGRFASAMLWLSRPSNAATLGNKELAVTVCTMCALLAVHWRLRDTTLEAFVDRLPSWLWSGVCVVMLLAIILIPGDERAFIYFQF